MTRGSTELFDCARVSDYLESYLSGQVPPPERRGMRLHIHGCPNCHRVVMERDPLQFFAPLADQERGEGGANAWDGFYDAIRDGIAADTRKRSLAARRRIRLAVAASVLVVVSVGMVASYLLMNRERPAVVAPVTLADDTPAAFVTQASLSDLPLPQTVERVTGTGVGEVQIYTMNYYREELGTATSQGGAGQTAELVLIVDAGIEL